MNQNETIFIDDYSNFMEEYVDADLEHYRRGGERKGIRNYQYEDGSLTPLGRIHYGVGPPREKKAEEPEKPKTPDKSADTSEPKGLKKVVSDFKQRRADRKAAEAKKFEEAKAEAERKARYKRLQEGKIKAKEAREQHAKEVEEMTKTPEDLIKNRDKLTDEEFNAAADRFREMKKRQKENDKFLNDVKGLRLGDDTPSTTPQQSASKESKQEDDPLMPKPFEKRTSRTSSPGCGEKLQRQRADR